MTEYFFIFIGALLINNFVLTHFLGLCPFLGVSKRNDTALGMGLATLLVLTLAAAICYLLYHFLLVPLGLADLRTFSFILVIATLVQIIERLLRATRPALHRMLGIYLPLITTNCAVLGVTLININQRYDFLSSIINAAGAALGLALVLMLFAHLRERLSRGNVPLPFKGSPIALVTAGLMSLAFMGFSGLTRFGA